MFVFHTLFYKVIKFIIELSLVDLRMIRHKPSLLVAAAVLLSNELFGDPAET